MRFGVLGPVAAWTDDGRPVKIPDVKVRALLADLLVHEGRPVPVDRLIDDLWGERLPRNPLATLQTRVSQLRRALEDAEPGGRGLVVSQQPGYLLEAAALDASDFQRLTAQARAAGTVEERTARLGEALALWRGAPYADFADAEFARSAITRLEEERLTALEEQAETRLDLGEHAALTAELSDLISAHPLRERLRAVHMRALYRTGRQSDALASYADLRERLADELGLDPAPELAALYEAILKQDPALAPAPERTPGNLPAAVHDLIGRADAVSEVRGLLGDARLVTLTGPGGVGKTSLAMEVARGLDGAFPDGVWVVELAGLDRDSQSGAADVVAAVLGARDDDKVPLPDRLRGKRTLLLLDNCEHVVEQAADLAALLLRNAPDLRVLATSQEPLGIAGETLWPVPPLESPGDGAEAAFIERFSAVRLFAARVAAAVPGFAVGPDNAGAVTSICRRLDGVPLALELAASRVRALGVQELAARLDDRFGVLVSGRRDAPARQRTLRAMIDWSWEPLTDAERTVLRRLAVHADGCTLETAEHVCAAPGLDVLDALARLVDRSLVVMAEGPRYRLLDSVRAYALERLEEAGEAEEIRRRHVEHNVALAERAQNHLYGRSQQEWLERLDVESADLRTALDHADPADALRLVNALSWYWFLQGRLIEARRALEHVLATATSDLPGHLEATIWQAGFALLTCDGTDKQARLNAERIVYGQLPDPGMRAWAQWFLGFANRGFGDLKVTSDLVDRALEGFREQGDRWGTAAALSVRATINRARADLAAARRDAAESHAVFCELGDRWGGLHAAGTLADLSEIAGDYEEAARLHEQSLRMAEELGLHTQASFTLSGLGRIALLRKDLATADDLHERARRLAIRQSNKVAEHFAEVGLALAARRRGDLDRAEAHLVKWLDWIRRVDGEPGLALVSAELGYVAELRGDEAEARRWHNEGLAAARRIGDPRAVAMALEGLAGVEALAGDAVRAARLLGTSEALRASVGAPLPVAERGDVERVGGAVRGTLGEEGFATERGRPLDVAGI
ncbi:BTAD domain-containing putative transcriptional regulator [Actinomadura hibisca]|uniref:BTAD domain-containing putative transcriptional regulator n=1 Tax=Actinomadura hibisca TaxID=68565 RepID=UPI000836D307|nr:BTAD domain-containing putative transcriptional regulator [Actinomadura hibisca]